MNVHDTVNLLEKISGGTALIIFVFKYTSLKTRRGETKQVSMQGMRGPVEYYVLNLYVQLSCGNVLSVGCVTIGQLGYLLANDVDGLMTALAGRSGAQKG